MNPYHILGIDETATIEEAKSAYRKKALQYHPDRNKSPNAAAKFIEVSWAYDQISKGYSNDYSESYNYTYSPVPDFDPNTIFEESMKSDDFKFGYSASILLQYGFAIFLWICFSNALGLLAGTLIVSLSILLIIYILKAIHFHESIIYPRDIYFHFTYPDFFSFLHNYQIKNVIQSVLGGFFSFFVLLFIGSRTFIKEDIYFSILAGSILLGIGIFHYTKNTSKSTIPLAAFSTTLLINFVWSSFEFDVLSKFEIDHSSTEIHIPDKRFDDYSHVFTFLSYEDLKNNTISFEVHKGFFGISILKNLELKTL